MLCFHVYRQSSARLVSVALWLPDSKGKNEEQISAQPFGYAFLILRKKKKSKEIHTLPENLPTQNFTILY